MSLREIIRSSQYVTRKAAIRQQLMPSMHPLNKPTRDISVSNRSHSITHEEPFLSPADRKMLLYQRQNQEFEIQRQANIIYTKQFKSLGKLLGNETMQYQQIRQKIQTLVLEHNPHSHKEDTVLLQKIQYLQKQLSKKYVSSHSHDLVLKSAHQISSSNSNEYLKTLQNQLGKKSKLINQLSDSIKRQTFEDAYLHLNTQVNEKQRSLRILQEQMQDYKSKSAASITFLQEQLVKQKQTIQKLTFEIGTWKRKAQNNADETERLKKKQKEISLNMETKASYQGISYGLSALLLQLQARDKQLQVSLQQRQYLQSELESLKNQYLRHELNDSKIQQRLLQYQQKINVMDIQNNKLQTNLSKLSQQLKESTELRYKLNFQLQQANNNISRLSLQLNQSYNKSNVLKNQLNSCNSELEEKIRHSSNINTNINQMQVQSRQANNNISRLTLNLKESFNTENLLRDQLESSNIELQEKINSEKNINGNMSQMETFLREANSNISRLNLQLQQSVKRSHLLKNQLDDCNAELQEKIRNIGFMNTRINQLELQLNQANNQISKLSIDLKQSIDISNILKNQLEKRNSELKEKTNQTNLVTGNINQIQFLLNGAENKNRQYLIVIQNMRIQRQTILQENDKIRGQINQLIDVNQKLNNDISTQNQMFMIKLHEYQLKQGDADLHMNQVRSKYSSLQQQIGNLHDQNEGLKLRQRNLSSQISYLEGQIANLRSERQSLAHENKTLIIRINETSNKSQGQIDRLKFQLQNTIHQLALQSQQKINRLNIQSQERIRKVSRQSQQLVSRMTLKNQQELQRMRSQSQNKGNQLASLSLSQQQHESEAVQSLKEQIHLLQTRMASMSQNQDKLRLQYSKSYESNNMMMMSFKDEQNRANEHSARLQEDLQTLEIHLRKAEEQLEKRKHIIEVLQHKIMQMQRQYEENMKSIEVEIYSKQIMVEQLDRNLKETNQINGNKHGSNRQLFNINYQKIKVYETQIESLRQQIKSIRLNNQTNVGSKDQEEMIALRKQLDSARHYILQLESRIQQLERQLQAELHRKSQNNKTYINTAVIKQNQYLDQAEDKVFQEKNRIISGLSKQSDISQKNDEKLYSSDDDLSRNILNDPSKISGQESKFAQFLLFDNSKIKINRDVSSLGQVNSGLASDIVMNTEIKQQKFEESILSKQISNKEQESSKQINISNTQNHINTSHNNLQSHQNISRQESFQSIGKKQEIIRPEQQQNIKQVKKISREGSNSSISHSLDNVSVQKQSNSVIDNTSKLILNNNQSRIINNDKIVNNDSNLFNNQNKSVIDQESHVDINKKSMIVDNISGKIVVDNESKIVINNNQQSVHNMSEKSINDNASNQLKGSVHSLQRQLFESERGNNNTSNSFKKKSIINQLNEIYTLRPCAIQVISQTRQDNQSRSNSKTKINFSYNNINNASESALSNIKTVNNQLKGSKLQSEKEKELSLKGSRQQELNNSKQGQLNGSRISKMSKESNLKHQIPAQLSINEVSPVPLRHSQAKINDLVTNQKDNINRNNNTILFDNNSQKSIINAIKSPMIQSPEVLVRQNPSFIQFNRRTTEPNLARRETLQTGVIVEQKRIVSSPQMIALHRSQENYVLSPQHSRHSINIQNQNSRFSNNIIGYTNQNIIANKALTSNNSITSINNLESNLSRQVIGTSGMNQSNLLSINGNTSPKIKMKTTYGRDNDSMTFGKNSMANKQGDISVDSGIDVLQVDWQAPCCQMEK